MLHRFLKLTRPPNLQGVSSSSSFSLGFSSHRSMEKVVEQILKNAAEMNEAESPISLELPSPSSIPLDPGFKAPEVSLYSPVFSKKTISKNKTLKSLSHPLKSPSYLQKKTPPLSPVTPSAPLILNSLKNTFAAATTEPPNPASLRLPISSIQSINSSILSTRLAIGKELLKLAASCQMISIQEAHSMGSKLSLPESGLLIPPLSELLHRKGDSVQKILLQKNGSNAVPFNYFKALIGNQSVLRLHSILIPYRMIPVFYRGNSLTLLAEHPLSIALAEIILKLNHFTIPWIHCIPVELSELESIP